MIPPLGIVARESTETVAFKDPRLCHAIEYLNKNIEDPIGVQELASHVGVSRRWMEYAFRDALGREPLPVHPQPAPETGAAPAGKGPPTKIYQVAPANGLQLGQAMSMAFGQEFGVSPREYQRSRNG